MFDIGGWEFLVIVILAIVIIGPKDLPAAVRAVTGWIRKARGLARDFQSGLDDIAREAEFDQVKAQITDGLAADDLTADVRSIRADIEHSIDPQGEIGESFEEINDLLDDQLDSVDTDDAAGADQKRIETAAADETPAPGGAPAAAGAGGKKGA